MINPKTPKTAIFVPTVNRPQNMWRVLDNVRETTPESLYALYFILEASDEASIDQAQKLQARYLLNAGQPCYADAINTAYTETKEPYFFCGADDLGFHKGWLENALSCMTPGTGVVGTNDLGSPDVAKGLTATHFLVARWYIVTYSGRMDKENTVMFPYQHNYCDTEFIETAKSRDMFVPCMASVVEHLHWAWGKAEMDETYRKGLAANGADNIIYRSRHHLWAK